MNFKQISAAELENYIGKDDITIIDIRDKQAYNNGHIPGAINIPYKDLVYKIHKINQNKTIVLYCERGGSSFVAAKLLENEYDIMIVIGGIKAYRGKIE